MANVGREVKDGLYEQFARIGKAVGHPKRLEILDVLSQGERSVEVLAAAVAASMVNTSAHLRVLRESRLVDTRKNGTKVFYRLPDDTVTEFVFSLRELAASRYAEVERILHDFLVSRDVLDPVTQDELVALASDDDVVIIDVRPTEEYEAGHIPGAVSIPLAELADRMGELPTDADVVAYCRGTYCVLAPQAVGLLNSSGFKARRLSDGLPEWRTAGLPVVAGTLPRR
jgi:rhodanese-related sulfurtransferase/DNA-binding transcriptional ArsR family regulator